MIGITAYKDIVYHGSFDLKLDVYVPEVQNTRAVFIFFHGGGFEDYRQKDMGEPLSRELATNGITCVNPAYRHYPNAAFPDYITDGAEAVSWVFHNISKYGEYSDIFIGGHSAGAYLSMLLCFDRDFLAGHGIDAVNDISGYVFCSGQPTTHMNVLREGGIDPRAVVVDERSPIFHVRNTGAPLLIACAGNDILNRLEQTNLLVSTLKHFDYQSDVNYMVFDGYGHNNYLYPDEDKPDKPSAGSVVIADFIRRNTKK